MYVPETAIKRSVPRGRAAIASARWADQPASAQSSCQVRGLPRRQTGVDGAMRDKTLITYVPATGGFVQFTAPGRRRDLAEAPPTIQGRAFAFDT